MIDSDLMVDVEMRISSDWISKFGLAGNDDLLKFGVVCESRVFGFILGNDLLVFSIDRVMMAAYVLLWV